MHCGNFSLWKVELDVFQLLCQGGHLPARQLILHLGAPRGPGPLEKPRIPSGSQPMKELIVTHLQLSAQRNFWEMGSLRAKGHVGDRGLARISQAGRVSSAQS